MRAAGPGRLIGVFHPMSSFKSRASEELAAKRGRLSGKQVLVGFDGFVDTIVTPVALRTGVGTAFTPIDTIADFGNRILAAAGKSTNIELYPRMDKLGGNGPIMANALLAAGWKTRYVGALGTPTPHPVFQDLATRSEAISTGNPGFTTAAEFKDGKIMLGNTSALEQLTYEAIVGKMGEGMWLDLLSRSDLVALVNWTMIPHMTDIFTAILDRALAVLPPRENRFFFFDLADPEKRSKGDLLAALKTMGRFQAHGSVTLGLNLKEAEQVNDLLGFRNVIPDEPGLKAMAAQIRQKLAIGTVVIHPKESAACATRDGAWWVPGPYCDEPLITTGAGDHFNAGFTTGQLLGFTAEAALALGVCTSGHYVRTAKSPSLGDLDAFLRSWN